jgi:FAD/FMN-containing dehydrogenase
VFDGDLFLRGDDGYEQARVGRIFNGRRPDQFPAAVLEAASEADVVLGVRYAIERGWQVRARAGGHSWAAWSLQTDTLLIDLGRLRSIELAADRKTARVNPAVQGNTELAPFLSAHGVGFPGGHCPTVGVGGFVLQGGQGWNGRVWGWACENIMAIDVVTADGELVHATETEHADLLWAARGSGPGFFGLVTAFHLRVHPKPPVFVQTTYVFPTDAFDELITWAHSVLPTLERAVEPVIVGVGIPEPAVLMHTTAMCSSMEEARRLMAPLETCPVLDRAIVREFCLPTSFDEEGVQQAAANPEHARYHTDCLWTDASAEELVPRLRELMTNMPTPRSFAIWYGWDPVRPLPDMAFSMEGNVYIAAYVIADDEAHDAECRSWLQARMNDLAPVAKGVYLGDSDFTVRPAKFMADANFARLEALREKHDPKRVFPGYHIKAGHQLNVNPSPTPYTPIS